MAVALFLALQAAQASAPAKPLPVDFDLAIYQPSPSEGCGSQDPGEIVVCGRRPLRNEYPLEEMERLFTPRPLVAERSLGGSSTARAFVESAEMPGGQVSKRFMIGVKSRF